jgi:membrane protease YdiL (CAAX protease family)
VELVRRCRAAGLKVAVASSADLIKIQANLDRIGLPLAEWNAVVHGEAVEHKKPAPDIFLAAARQLGVASAECVVVEDAVNGIEAAKAAGMRCVAVAQTFPAEKLTKADIVRPDMLAVTLEDLTGNSSTPPTPPAGGLPTGGVPAAEPPPLPKGPWGFWATAGLGLLVAGAVLGLQILIGVVWAVVFGGIMRNSDGDPSTNGTLWAVASCAGAPMAVAGCVLAAALRRGTSLRDYLGVNLPSWRDARPWVFTFLLLLAAMDGASLLLGKPQTPEVMVKVYRSASPLPLLWFGIVVAAPVSEEIFFRGFLFRGWERSPLGGMGTILLTSVCWAAGHLQYDLYGISQVLVTGLVLGLARWRTGSVLLTMLLHAIMNLIATLQTAVYCAVTTVS